MDWQLIHQQVSSLVCRSPILKEHNASFHVVFGELKSRLHQRAFRKKEKDPVESLSDKALAKEQQPDTVAQKHVGRGGSVAFITGYSHLPALTTILQWATTTFKKGIYFEYVGIHRCYSVISECSGRMKWKSIKKRNRKNTFHPFASPAELWV